MQTRIRIAACCAGVPAARVKQEEQTDALSCAHLGWCEIALAPPPRLNRLASRSLSKLTKTLAECREVFPQLLIIQQHARDEKTGLCSSDALSGIIAHICGRVQTTHRGNDSIRCTRNMSH